MNDARPTPRREHDDPRLDELCRWLERDLGYAGYEIEPASADASFRRYFRVTRTGEPSVIVMDAPPGREDVGPFVRVARMLEQIGVNAPRVLERSEGGFLLLTDLGERMYLPELHEPGRADPLYEDAIDALVRIQARGAASARELPVYDERLLRFEMGLFPEWLLARHLALVLDADEARVLAQAMDALVANALSQPQVFVHRDYHSRNLMVCPGRNPGILDFQDAVRGASTYDLVSLLRDAYVEWPHERVVGWIRLYRARAAAAGLDAGTGEEGFLRDFDLMGLQRQLKVAGIFARLCHRDGKRGYLADIPRTLGYAVGACRRQPGFADLGRLLESRVLPAVLAALDAPASRGP